MTKSQSGVSISVLVREFRPWTWAVGLTAFLVYWASPASHGTSLLADLVNLLGNLRLYLNDAFPLLVSPFIGTIWRLFEDILAILAVLAFFRVFYICYHYSWNEWKFIFTTIAFDWAQSNLQQVKEKLIEQEEEIIHKSEAMLKKNPNRTLTLSIPKSGRKSDEIIHELQCSAVQENDRWAKGKLSGTVYQGSPEHSELMTRVFSLYSWSNPLHPGIWPKLGQCEGEVVSMTSSMLHGPGFGCMTSGGTESILLAIRAHLNHYGKARGIRHAELICASTAHAAVDKACDIYGIRKVVIEANISNGYQLDPVQVRRHITSNTILIYASAPCYPQGVVDPIGELSELAVQYDIGLHVDACLGGFILPFVADAPVFDFRNPGVTSMSADTHKYGYAVKGTSVVMYKSKELRHGQYFCYAHWTGGMYATPTLAGSRPGALSACAWAALVSIGEEGYRSRAESIVRAARTIAKGITSRFPDLYLLTVPQPFMVVCFASDTLDIYSVLDAMSELGDWSLVSLQSPACIHLCVTLNVVPKVNEFLSDLHMAVAQVRKEQDILGYKKKGTAGIYGAVGSAPAGAVEPTLRTFTDMMLAP